MNTPGEPDDGKSITSGSVGGTRKPTVVIRQGGGCLPYDISVIYLFVEGSYVGEAYCPALMGRRVSEWEAVALRQHDKEQKRAATQEGREARARTQDEAASSRNRRAAQIRAGEQSRQHDRQRQEIHPARVLERLASLEPEVAESLKLPPAIPDPEPDRPVRVLPIR